jgi:hypothetical protein
MRPYAMRCDALRCDAMRCDAMRCDAMRCDAMLGTRRRLCEALERTGLLSAALQALQLYPTMHGRGGV